MQTKCRPYSAVVCIEKTYSRVQRHIPWSGGEAETFLAFGRSMEAQICLSFNNWKCKKNHEYMCCFAKMMFNKSHLSMSMVTRGHFITTKIFPVGEQPGARTKARGFPLPLAPPTITVSYTHLTLPTNREV